MSHLGTLIVQPAIAQLAEHLTVNFADIRWSLVRFRVAGHCAKKKMSYPLTTCTTSKVSENLASAFISALNVYQNDRALVGPPAIIVERRVRHIVTACFATCSRTVWPSGLRRWLQAPVRKGVGSNPTAVTFPSDQVRHLRVERGSGGFLEDLDRCAILLIN